MDKSRVQIAAKLYDSHDAMKKLYGDRFPEKMREFRGFIHAAMRKWKCDELKATMQLVAGLQRSHPFDSGTTQALVLAACVELIEPSEPTPTTAP